MIKANVAEVGSRFSHYLGLAQTGEVVQICDLDVPIAHLVAVKSSIDLGLRESAFGLYSGLVSVDALEEALRPLSVDEVDAFLDGHY